MTRFWKRHDEDALGDELRRRRAEPPAGLLQSLVDRIADEPHHVRGGSLRPALAGAFTAVLLIGFAVFGGASYASSVAHQVTKVVNVVKVAKSNDSAKATAHDGKASSSKSTEHSSKNGADEDQYRPGKGCGDKNHVHDRHDECKGKHHGNDD